MTKKNLIAQNQVSDSTEYLEQLLDDLINIEDVEVEVNTALGIVH